MERKLKLRTAFLVLLTTFSAFYLVPTLVGDLSRLPVWYSNIFHNKVQLGLDLQGGLHIVYGIDLDKAVDDRAGELKRDIETKLEEAKLEAQVSNPREPLGSVYITAPDEAALDKVSGDFLEEYEELVETDCAGDVNDDTTLCLGLSSEFSDTLRESALEQAISTIHDRINRYGVSEPSILRKGDDIVVELPGLIGEEIERVKSIVDRTAKLEFKVVDEGSDYMNSLYRRVKIDVDPEAESRGITADLDQWSHPQSGELLTDPYLAAQDRKVFLDRSEAEKYGCYRPDKEAPGGKYECLITGRRVLEEYLATLPEDLRIDGDHELSYEEIVPRGNQTGTTENTWRTYYLLRTAELTGQSVAEASPSFEATTNRPVVIIEFDRQGGRRFADLTTKIVGKKLAIILDERVNSAPTIDEPILGGSAQIRMGSFDSISAQREVEDLVNVLRTGSLPAPLREMSSSRVGPMLGQDAIDRGALSMGLGALAVVFVMLFFYRLAGLFAVVAMTLNVLLQLTVLAGLQATLTLPGIAALVLTIGMAVDANIIIYERIREELRSGKSNRGSVDAGFGRAFWTIFDAQVTTLIAGMVLYEYGSGPIQGFAVMLIIGVLCNLFTSTWCSRLFFDHYLARKKSATDTISI